MGLQLVIIGGLAAAICGPLAAMLPGSAEFRTRIYILTALISSTAGICGIGLAALYPDWAIFWPAILDPTALQLGADSLSLFFLLPTFIIWASGSCYSSFYGKGGPRTGTHFWMRFFWGTALAGMVLLLIARHSLVFLFGWEIMAVSAFFLVAADHVSLQGRQAAWVYFVASHVGTTCLIAMFFLISSLVGSLGWDSTINADAPAWRLSLILLLGLTGFGIKSGIMPLHIWLPEAHANAPVHVSAFMSGVLISMGIYGQLRLLSFFPYMKTWWGALLLIAGLASAFLGILASSRQNDLKRALAFSSIENMGIVICGIGLAIIGQAENMPELGALGGVAALYHVFAHSTFKSLLFLSSGIVIHATHTRELNCMGGLASQFPVSRNGFWVGALSASTLPLGCGFIGEFLLILAMGNGILSSSIFVEALSVLGIIILVSCGAIAGVSYSRVLFGVFAGAKRCGEVELTCERNTALTGPIGGLALLCAVQGILPVLIAPLLPGVLAIGFPGLKYGLAASTALNSLYFMSLIFACIGAVVTVALVGISWRMTKWRRVGTWDCGYVGSTSPRMQYSPSSFNQLLGSVFPHFAQPISVFSNISSIQPGASSFRTTSPDRLLRSAIIPFFVGWERRLNAFKIIQQGKVQIYLLYIYIWFLAGLSYSIIYSILE